MQRQLRRKIPQNRKRIVAGAIATVLIVMTALQWYSPETKAQANGIENFVSITGGNINIIKYTKWL